MESELPFYLYFIVLAISIGGLIWGAERFVVGAAGIASNLGISQLIIGLTVVSFGTSAPEILVSGTAALNGSPSLAVGNALGSNLANIGLVLAITALIAPLVISSRIARWELPIMLLITCFAGFVLFDGFLGRIESIFLLLSLVCFLIYVVKTAKNHPIDTDIEIKQMAWVKAGLLTVGGLAILIFASNALVWSATEIALEFGVSELVIGLTVVAVGTSLPELAASVAGALKGHSELAIGNVIGSNIFNLTAVLPIAGIIYPASIDGANFWQDYGFVFGLSLFLTLICLVKVFIAKSHTQNNPARIGRIAGVFMLLVYISYYGLLFS